MNRRSLPSELMSRSDDAWEHARYGDRMIRLTRWLRRLSIPLAGVIGVAVGWVTSLIADWLALLGLFAGYLTMMRLQRLAPRVPWVYDFRQPLLVLRSYTDRRTKIGGSLAPDALGRPAGMNPYIWQLSRAVWDWGRVILLQEEANDAGLELFGIVLAPDHEWEVVVLDVARRSWVIVIFPADTPSCISEIRLLDRHGLLTKTVVFMPPMPSTLSRILGRLLAGMRNDESHDADWEGLRTSLAGHHLELPSYDARGMLYVPTPTLGVARRILLNHNDCPWRRLPELLPDPGFLAEPLWNLLNHGQACEADDPTCELGGTAAQSGFRPGQKVFVQRDALYSARAKRDNESGSHVIGSTSEVDDSDSGLGKE